jgi:molecular chaperone GrpE (heat shock protein)
MNSEFKNFLASLSNDNTKTNNFKLKNNQNNKPKNYNNKPKNNQNNQNNQNNRNKMKNNGNNQNNQNNQNNKNNNNNNKSTDFLVNLLKLQNQVKIYHWQTKSHARHMATDKFLSKFSSVLDNIIEAYQGRYGTISVKSSMIKIDDIPDEKMIEFLLNMRNYLVDIAPNLFDRRKDGDLFNLRDEILESIDIAVYLFNQK